MFDPGRPVSPTEIAHWFGVTPQAIHMWAKRGYLTPADHRGKRDGARYWIKDLREAEMRARSQTQRSHRVPRRSRNLLAPA
jgi:hypothetical protein